MFAFFFFRYLLFLGVSFFRYFVSYLFPICFRMPATSANFPTYPLPCSLENFHVFSLLPQRHHTSDYLFSIFSFVILSLAFRFRIYITTTSPILLSFSFFFFLFCYSISQHACLTFIHSSLMFWVF